MTIQVLLPGAVLAAIATSSVGPEALLSPRAAGNQINVVPGVANDINPGAIGRATVNGTPKAVIECRSQASMPGCATLAAAKQGK